jgi:nucleoside diphosphate kinase
VAQRTFSIVKPDAVRKGFTGAILAEIDKAGFQIVAIKKQSISKEQAEGFYASTRASRSSTGSRRSCLRGRWF